MNHVVDMCDRDKHTINGASLLTVFAKRARSVEKALVHDKICGIVSENTKTITLRILYHLKLARTHLLTPESAEADLLPSTLLTGNATDSPWVTTSSITNFPHTTRKKQN